MKMFCSALHVHNMTLKTKNGGTIIFTARAITAKYFE